MPPRQRSGAIMPDGSLKDGLNASIDITSGVVTLRPEAPLKVDDFTALSDLVDSYLLKKHKLHGLLIIAEHFPGWDSFAAFVKHLRFVGDHHTKIEKVAIVTDSAMGRLAESLAAHFILAEVRHFPSIFLTEAKTWLDIPVVEAEQAKDR